MTHMALFPPGKQSVGGISRRGLRPLVALLVFATVMTLLFFDAGANGERTQRGNLIASLDGRFLPLKLPRHRPAPVAVELEGGLHTSDGSPLPRVTRIEFGLPRQGVLSPRGLAICPRRRLRNTTHDQALAVCREALVGHGRLEADVAIPGQRRFRLSANVLAFNGRIEGRPAVLVHAYAPNPPTMAVLPFVIRHRPGRLGLALVARLGRSLGPVSHLARFEVLLSRRFSFRGEEQSYLRASCPLPPRWTEGHFSFARATFRFAEGSSISQGIARSCRAS